MRALAVALALAACGAHDGGAPAPAPPDVTVGAGAIVAGALRVAVSDDPMGQYRALRDALAGQLHGVAHPVVAVAADARSDAALVTIAALEDAGADHVEVRAPDGHRVCDLARPPKRTSDAMLSVLVTPDTTFLAQVGGDIQQVPHGVVARVVAQIGAAAAYQGRTDAEFAVASGVPATDALDVIGALCARFPALAMRPPAGLTTAPML